MPAKKPQSKKTTSRSTSKLPAWMTEVTPVSKALAMTVFILLPFFSFWMGMRFQHQMLKEFLQSSQVVIRKGCSMPEQWLRDKEESGAEDDRMGKKMAPTPTPVPRT